MNYFAYSYKTGFELLETAEKARAAAEEMIAAYQEEAADGWSEEVENVCWGEVRQMAAMTNQRPPEPGSACDFICDYELCDVTD